MVNDDPIRRDPYLWEYHGAVLEYVELLHLDVLLGSLHIETFAPLSNLIHQIIIPMIQIQKKLPSSISSWSISSSREESEFPIFEKETNFVSSQVSQKSTNLKMMSHYADSYCNKTKK